MELKEGHGAFLFREGFVERARRNQEIPGQPSRKGKRKGIGKKSTSPRNNMPLHLRRRKTCCFVDKSLMPTTINDFGSCAISPVATNGSSARIIDCRTWCHPWSS